jgi:LacI family transcriptional regulator, galactose operon repressor
LTFTTIHDVAQAAGVSVSTASRALSGRRKVSPEARRAVLAASERLGYRANTVARSLRMQSTASVGMVVPGISNPYFPLLVEAVERTLSAEGRELLLCDSRDDPVVESARVDALLDRRVDGLLFIPCDQQASADTLRRARASARVVQLDRYVDGEAVDFVGVDNRAGMVLVIDHLAAGGCRSFAFVSSVPADSSAELRLGAYRDAVRNRCPDREPDVLLGSYSLQWGREAARRLLDRATLPDAVVCGADVIALGVLTALVDAGVRVPEQVAVTGFDDIAFAEISAPPLTTLRQPADAIGAMGIQLLYEGLSGVATPQHVSLLPRLVVRGSSRPVPARPAAPPTDRKGLSP